MAVLGPSRQSVTASQRLCGSLVRFPSAPWFLVLLTWMGIMEPCVRKYEILSLHSVQGPMAEAGAACMASRTAGSLSHRSAGLGEGVTAERQREGEGEEREGVRRHFTYNVSTTFGGAIRWSRTSPSATGRRAWGRGRERRDAGWTGSEKG